jgi:hypothetical protein
MKTGAGAQKNSFGSTTLKFIYQRVANNCTSVYIFSMVAPLPCQSGNFFAIHLKNLKLGFTTAATGSVKNHQRIIS